MYNNTHFGNILKQLTKCYKVISKVLKVNGALAKNCGDADGFWRIRITERFLMRYSIQKKAAPSVFGSVTPVRLDRHLENKRPI